MVAPAYDPTTYKLTSMRNWDVVAPDYHSSWAGIGKGPFRSTAELVRAAEIRTGVSVLDVACGTGAVSAAVMKKLGHSGSLLGIDFSRGALAVARTSLPLAQFIQMDAENIGLFGRHFDNILCQYGLMFFPDAHKVLLSLRKLLKPGGRLSLAVHGTAEGVPYFSTIMKPVLEFIPDIRPSGAPTVHRFGEPHDLRQILGNSGYRQISITKFSFDYQAGTFDQYWSDYLSTTASSIRARIESSRNICNSIKERALERARGFMHDGKIEFPWDVLIATAQV